MTLIETKEFGDALEKLKVVTFSAEFESQVVDLVLGIQRGEFGIEITEADQPDLRAIPSFYQKGVGNFWIALDQNRVVGSISLIDIGANQGAIRKMFVQSEYRGRELGVSQQLLDTLLSWAIQHNVREIFLGTLPILIAAHRFYEKNGFVEIAKSNLPPSFPVMEIDTKFYCYSESSNV